jgi:hypothetical protein
LRLFVRYLLNRTVANFEPGDTPPYIITQHHIDDVYISQDLHHAIRDRFMWTLALDPRYRIIAFSIALYSRENDVDVFSNGFSITWVREQAATFWPDGFQYITLDELRTLLDELVGLGILRGTDYGTYMLRNPNLLSLLGTQTEIEDQLLNSL